MAQKARVIVWECSRESHDVSIILDAKEHLEKTGLAEILTADNLEEALKLLLNSQERKTWLIYHLGYAHRWPHLKEIKPKFPNARFACYSGASLYHNTHPGSINAQQAEMFLDLGYDFILNDNKLSYLEMLAQ